VEAYSKLAVVVGAIIPVITIERTEFAAVVDVASIGGAQVSVKADDGGERACSVNAGIIGAGVIVIAYYRDE